MFHPFPTIENINDVLPHIQDREEFLVIDKGDFTVIQYAYVDKETFPGDFNLDLPSAIKRECRGLVFCNKTGTLLRRPYHKFFNIGEREETQPNELSLSYCTILDKVDGTMIAPFILNDEVIWATKLVAMDFHEQIKEFVKSNPYYEHFVRTGFMQGYTCIFEWVAPDNRIVVEYTEPNLILTAVRNMRYGDYVDYGVMADIYSESIPVVGSLDFDGTIESLIEKIDSAEGLEGVVVRYDGAGQMVKLKSSWYIGLHKAKDFLSDEKSLVKLFIEGNMDDLKPHLLSEDLKRVEEFEVNLANRIKNISIEIESAVKIFKHVSRKDFSLNHSNKFDPLTAAAIFKFYGQDVDNDEVIPYVTKTISKYYNTNTSYKKIKEHWLNDISF